jgi:hypothetical protein
MILPPGHTRSKEKKNNTFVTNCGAFLKKLMQDIALLKMTKTELLDPHLFPLHLVLLVPHRMCPERTLKCHILTTRIMFMNLLSRLSRSMLVMDTLQSLNFIRASGPIIAALKPIQVVLAGLINALDNKTFRNTVNDMHNQILSLQVPQLSQIASQL